MGLVDLCVLPLESGCPSLFKFNSGVWLLSSLMSFTAIDFPVIVYYTAPSSIGSKCTATQQMNTLKITITVSGMLRMTFSLTATINIKRLFQKRDYNRGIPIHLDFNTCLYKYKPPLEFDADVDKMTRTSH